MAYLMSNKTHMEFSRKINEISFLLTIRHQILIYLASCVGDIRASWDTGKDKAVFRSVGLFFFKLSLFPDCQTCVQLSGVSWKVVEIKGD